MFLKNFCLSFFLSVEINERKEREEVKKKKKISGAVLSNKKGRSFCVSCVCIRDRVFIVTSMLISMVASVVLNIVDDTMGTLGVL